MQRRAFFARALGKLAAAVVGALPSMGRCGPLPSGGRLTLASGRPILPTDKAATVYSEPYAGRSIPMSGWTYTTTGWRRAR